MYRARASCRSQARRFLERLAVEAARRLRGVHCSGMCEAHCVAHNQPVGLHSCTAIFIRRLMQSRACLPRHARYLPLAVRKSQHVRMTNNAHRAREAAEGQTTIKDRMDERITVAGVSLLVGEWVPFGSNQARPTPDASQHARKSSITHVAE